MAQAKRDQNSVTTLLAVSSVDGITPVVLWADPTTHRLLVDAGTGVSGSVYVTIGTSDADYLVSNYIDIGDAINHAYAALPSTGGTIYIKDGAYSYVTPIVINTAQKPLLLTGSPAGITTLTYTGVGTTIAFTFNVTKAITPGYGITGLKFVGPSSSGTTAGILLGGLGADDSKGFAGGTLRDVHIRGFGCNIVIGNNAFIVTFDNCVSNFGGKLLYAKGGAGAGATAWNVNGANTINSGENMNFIKCTFADSANGSGSSVADFGVEVQISGITDFQFIGCSFDDAQLYVNQFTGSVSTNNIHCTNCHFENPAANAITKYFFIDSIANQVGDQIYLTNCQFAQQASTSAPDAYIRTGSNIVLNGVTFMANFFSGASTVTRAVLLRDATAVNTIIWNGCNNIQSAVTYMVNTIAFAPSGIANGGSGYMTFDSTGKLIVSNANTVYDPTTFPGSDLGAQMNACYAASSDRCVHMRIPAGIFSFSTNAVFATNNKRVYIEGDPGEGTELRWTGSGKAITVNTGIQSSSPFISHSSGYGLRNFRLVGNDTTNLTNQTGIYCGGTNGAAHMIIDGVDVFGCGKGVETGANTYHWLFANGTIRDNVHNVHINSASNSGEMMHFFNAFVVDPANSTPTNGFFVDDYGAASLIITGGSIDDCQLALGLQISCTMNGVHMENPSSTWGAYTFITIADSSYSTLSMNGCVLMNDQSGAAKPTNFISSNGANVVMNGVTFFSNGGGTITNACVGGRFTWLGVTNAASCITNIASGVPYAYSGSNQTSLFTNFAGKITTYNGIATAGWGVPATYAAGRVTAQTAAAAALATYTVGGSDGTFVVSANILVTASVTNSFTMTCTYTDESNTSRTVTMTFSNVGGTFLNTITNVTGTGAYEGVPLHIRAKSGTAITFATVGTFTSVTYNAEGRITQVA